MVKNTPYKTNETGRKYNERNQSGRSYTPSIRTGDFSGNGTTSVIRDWKTGRSVHCLSQGEAQIFYTLRWNDNNIDVREQYQLNSSEISDIARELGCRNPCTKNHIMTTDFPVTEADGTLHAYSVKANRNLDRRTLEKLCIEKLYWTRKGCRFDLMFKEDVNEILAANIRLVTEFYSEELVFDKYSRIKHKIAVKEYKADMEHEILDCAALDRIQENCE